LTGYVLGGRLRLGTRTVIVGRRLRRVGFGTRPRERISTSQKRVESDVVGVVGDRVLVLDDTPTVVANLAVAARRTFCCRPVRHTVARGGIETEQLSTHAVVFETGAGPAIHAALGVQAEQFAGENAR